MRTIRRRVRLGELPSLRTLRAVLSAGLVIGATAGSVASRAGEFGFDYALDEFRMTGNVEFYDDFSDGSRNTPPTSAFVDYNGTHTVEADGYLILDSRNGSFPRPELGQDPAWIEGLVDAPVLVDGGTGTSTITASFRPDIPEPGFAGLSMRHYGIYLGTEGLRGVEIEVDQWFMGILRISFYDNRLFPGTAGTLGFAGRPVSSVTGNIVLELIVDHATDTVLPRFSIDGGATFVDGADWNRPARPGPVFDVRSDADVGFFAFGPVPEPGTALLFGSGLLGLVVVGRCRPRAPARNTAPARDGAA